MHLFLSVIFYALSHALKLSYFEARIRSGKTGALSRGPS